MARFEGRLVDWLGEHGHPGESLVSWMMLGYPESYEVPAGKSPMDAYVVERGLDPDRRFFPHQLQVFAAVTDRRVFLASARAIAMKPKEMLIDAPSDAFRVEWWDQPTFGPNVRHLLMFFDGRWVRTDAIATERSDTFLAALGQAAVQVSR